MNISLKGTLLVLLSMILFTSSAKGQGLMQIMKSELDREFSILSKEDNPVYFMSYKVTDANKTTITSSNGSIVMTNSDRTRSGSVDLRIGNYKRDNTQVQANSFESFSYGNALTLPNKNNEYAIKRAFWKATKSAYNRAKKEYSQVVFSEEEQKFKAFSQANPEVQKKAITHSGDVNIGYWTELAKSLSLEFVVNKDIVNSSVTFNYSDELEYFVSSEGSQVTEKQTYANFSISASIKAKDEIIPYYRTYFAFTPQGLPSREALEDEVKEVMMILDQLKEAPRAEPYSGPAILAPKVAGVFFHEIFGHRIEGHRLRSDLDGQTFKERLGEKVLSEFLSVVSDPTLNQYQEVPLSGAYNYDDEGVKSERVEIVKNGYLKTFLMSRQPLGSLDRSNGHGRGDTGTRPVARQSNLIVESSNGVNEQELRNMLIEACKEQGKDYGYYFKEVTGGYTQTNRYAINAFNIDPVLVYRVYVDGRPDEMVRGVNLIGTPLVMFGQINATGLKVGTFNGYCGAESGYIPVSATAPALFVERIETQKKPTTPSIEEQILSNPMLEKLNEGGKND